MFNSAEGYYTEDGGIAITERYNYYSGDYMDRIFNSCVDVTFPQTNGKVAESLMCDGKTGDDCNSKVYMDFQGAISNGFSPLDLIYTPVYNESDYIDIDPRIVPLDYPTFSCSKSWIDYDNNSIQARVQNIFRYNVYAINLTRN